MYHVRQVICSHRDFQSLSPFDLCVSLSTVKLNCLWLFSAGVQLYVHPSDPEFLGFHEGSIFSDSTVRNLLPAGNYYFSYELVEGVRSLLAAALDGTVPSRLLIMPSTLTPCQLHICA